MGSVIQPRAWVGIKLPSENVRFLQIVPNTCVHDREVEPSLSFFLLLTPLPSQNNITGKVRLLP